MKLEATVEGVGKEILIESGEGVTEVSIDGESKEYTVSSPEPGILLLKSENRVYEALVVETDSGLMVEVNGRQFALEVNDPRSLRSAGAGDAETDGRAEILSAMPGKVVSLLASVGDAVEKGDGILVVEAMKMQNELKAPRAGTVAEIRVAADDRVNSGDVLAVIE